jgi:hypothetical protein
MQARGQWPWFNETWPATIATLLERLADEAPSAEEGDNARKAASYLRTLPPAVMTSVLRTVMVEGAKVAFRFGAGLP